MASMVFASPPSSAQSLVKLRTNTNYPRSSCYVPLHSKPNSYVHLSYNISHIESSKSSFTKGDGFSKFSVQKFPRVASTLSPSLNIIKASSIHRFDAYELEKKQGHVRPIPTCLSDYHGKVLLIVNIPQQGSKWPEEIQYLNDLRQVYLKDGFEVLGFLYDKNKLEKKQEHGRTDAFRSFRKKPKGLFSHDKNELDEKSEAEILKILRKADFPIFAKVELNKNYRHIYTDEETRQPVFDRSTQEMVDKVLWYFLMIKLFPSGETIKKINEDFAKILVDREGIPQMACPWFEGETIERQDTQDGGNPGSRVERPNPRYERQDAQDGGNPGSTVGRPDPRYPLQNHIDEIFQRQMKQSDHQQN